METRDLESDLPEPPVRNELQLNNPRPKERRLLPSNTNTVSSSSASSGNASQAGSRKDDPKEESSTQRVACTECQRRKQKCNREWPCNHCQKRKIARKCRFNVSRTSLQKQPDTGSVYHAEKFSRTELTEEPAPAPAGGFEAIGYASSGHFFADLKLDPSGKETPLPQKQTLADTKSYPQLERVFQLLPSRNYTDSLVRNFLKNVNFHYYMIYPRTFVQEYRAWWEDRTAGRPLGLEWTCLLLMICACSTQFPSVKLQKKLERNLGDSCQTLTERFHTLGRAIHSAIPSGNNHILNVLQLLHSCYWFKSEARFGEAWHILDAAIREAQELRLHQETARREVSDFEREINRRLWCVLDTWDWQISALLSRPLIIDRAGCDVGLPTLHLETYSPSPLFHMKIQSGLIARLSAKFGRPKSVTTPKDVKEYQNMVEDWMSRLPPTYSMKNPDRSKDEAYPWIKLHRHYLHTAAYSTALEPTRAYLATTMNSSTDEEVLQIRRDGVNYSLSLMESLYGFFEHIWPRDAKFYFVIFSIFDTAAIHTSVLLHDEGGMVERRDDMLDAIDGALYMLKQLTAFTKPAQTYHDILVRLRKKVLKKLGLDKNTEPSRKRARITTITNQRPPMLTTHMAESGASEDDSSSISESLSDLCEADLGLRSESVPQPSEHMPSRSEPLEPPSSVIYPEGTLNMTPSPFLDDQWALQGTPAFQAPTPHNDHFGAGQRYGGVQEYDFGAAPPMEAVSYPAPDMGYSNMSTDDLGALAELWRWDSFDPGPSTNNANNPGQEG